MYSIIKNKKYIIVLFYVDNMIVIEDDIFYIQQFKDKLMSTFKMTDLKDAKLYLGIELKHTLIPCNKGKLIRDGIFHKLTGRQLLIHHRTDCRLLRSRQMYSLHHICTTAHRPSTLNAHALLQYFQHSHRDEC